MDLGQYRRYRREGGKESLWQWELAAGVTNWDQASAPGQVGRTLERFVTGRPPPDRWARATTNIVHWATGIGWGLQYGAVAGAGAGGSRPPWVDALALGSTAWLSSYVLLPPLGIYEPIWKYDAPTLVKDLADHLVFGLATTAAFRAAR
jgi:hypothetical protein